MYAGGPIRIIAEGVLSEYGQKVKQQQMAKAAAAHKAREDKKDAIEKEEGKKTESCDSIA